MKLGMLGRDQPQPVARRHVARKQIEQPQTSALCNALLGLIGKAFDTKGLVGLGDRPDREKSIRCSYLGRLALCLACATQGRTGKNDCIRGIVPTMV